MYNLTQVIEILYNIIRDKFYLKKIYFANILIGGGI